MIRSTVALFAAVISRVPGMVGAGYVLAVTAAVTGFVFFYGGKLVESRDWIGHRPAPLATSQSLADTFNLVRDRGLIRIDMDAADTPRIEVEDCSVRLRRPPAAPAEDPVSDKIPALKVLCDTPQGSQVMAEIDQWNASFGLLAVRDDIGRPARGKEAEAACTSDEPDAGEEHADVGNYLWYKCRDSRRHWTARLSAGSSAADNTGPEVEHATGFPPVRDYAMLAEQREPWMNDWSIVKPVTDAEGAPQPVIFTANTPAGARDETVFQVIGELKRVLVDGREVDVKLDCRGRQTVTLDRATVAVTLYVPRDKRHGPLRRGAGRNASCKNRIPDEKPGAYAVTIRAPGLPRRDIRFVALARQTRPTWRRMPSGRPVLRQLRQTANLTLTCDANTRTSCDARNLTWGPQRRDAGTEDDTGAEVAANADSRPEAKPAARPAARPGGKPEAKPDIKPEITDRNGAALIDQDGDITDDAFAAGLAPIVGLNTEDVGALAMALNRVPQKVVLSIDLARQRIVNEILQRKLREAGPKGQRAAVILLDLDDTPGSPPGQILAAASVPGLSEVYNIWDLQATLEFKPAQSPLLERAWRAPDARSTPGSTFKLVTSLAAIEYALGNSSNDRFRRLLTGMPAEEVKRILQVQPNPDRRERDALLVRVGDGDPCPPGTGCRAIMNASQEPRLETANLSNPESQCSPGAAPAARQIGICEALITSSNLYFGGLARLVDEPKVMLPGSTTRERRDRILDLAMVEMARRFVDDKNSMSLLEGVPEVVRRGAYRLWADPLRVAAEDAVPVGATRRYRVLLSGFGQAVSASPLAMATIYGSVAAGYVIRPRLTVSADADRHPRAPFLTQGTAEEQQRLMDIVRRGLSGVVFARAGTAHNSMPARDHFTGRLFAKTGTAQVGGDSVNGYTVWLAGWVNPASPGGSGQAPPRTGQAGGGQAGGSGQALGIHSRLGFICMVTDSGEDTGARRCGPIINDIIATLEGIPPSEPPSPRRRRAHNTRRR
jgi:hypothetical protein